MDDIKQLYSSLCIPSAANAYGIAIQYMKDWFLKKFNTNYWKRIYVDGRNVLDDFKMFNQTQESRKEWLKALKPKLAIIPQLQFDFNRENLDLYQAGINNLLRRSRAERSFLYDADKNLSLMLNMEQMQMNFTFKMMFNSRAQQIEMYKYIEMACRVGSTQGETKDIDFHIPTSLMIQVAKDAGFEVKNNVITNVISFLEYLNSHSIIPILYKYRGMTGNQEFFLRMPDLYIHIACLDKISGDDGEREGMINTNYGLELQAQLNIPIPKSYAYYSVNEHSDIQYIDNSNELTTGLVSIQVPDISDTNSKGWNKLITTDYEEDDLVNSLTIDFTELFVDSDIMKIIKYNNSIMISSYCFLDFALYNEGNKISYVIDWNTLKLTSDYVPVGNTISIAIYADTNYINEVLLNMKGMNDSRIG